MTLERWAFQTYSFEFLELLSLVLEVFDVHIGFGETQQASQSNV
jgi:hypothetical protein